MQIAEGPTWERGLPDYFLPRLSVQQGHGQFSQPHPQHENTFGSGFLMGRIVEGL
jgi:hypothetical protein